MNACNWLGALFNLAAVLTSFNKKGLDSNLRDLMANIFNSSVTHGQGF